MKAAGLLCTVFVASGCATAGATPSVSGPPVVGETRTGVPHAARPADCAVELAQVAPADMGPQGRFGFGGEYENIGVVTVGAPAGADALSPDIKQLVRPKVCAMGGEVLSLVATGTGAVGRGSDQAMQQNILFMVWAKRSAAAAATPQAF